MDKLKDPGSVRQVHHQPDDRRSADRSEVPVKAGWSRTEPASADRMIYVICSDIVPGLSEASLRAEIMAMIDGPNTNSSQPAASSDGV